MENWMEAIHMQEWLFVLSLLIVFFMLAVFGTRSNWVSTEIIMSVAFGLGFAIAPRQLLSYQTIGTLKEPEVALSRLYGITFLCTAFTWYRTRETRDATVTISLMMSRVFTGSILVMSQAFAWYAGATKSKSSDSSTGAKSTDLKWGEQFALMFMLPTGLWMIGNLLHLCRSHDFSTYPQHNIRLNNHLRLDAWFMLLIGAALLGFPNQIIPIMMTSASPNKVALHIARSIGALYIGEAIVSLQAPGFLHVRDKRALFLSRMISIVMQLAVLGFGFYNGDIAHQYLGCIVGIILPAFINSFVGYVTDGTTIYTVPTPKKNDKNE